MTKDIFLNDLYNGIKIHEGEEYIIHIENSICEPIFDHWEYNSLKLNRITEKR